MANAALSRCLRKVRLLKKQRRGRHHRRLLLQKWQSHAVDETVIAKLLRNAAFFPVEQADFAIDPESKTLSSGNLELHQVPRNGILRLWGKNSDICTAKALRLPISTACQVYFSYLVFGKTVQLRHYRVTVSVESLAIVMKPLGREFWEGCSSSKKRKSGDRPDRIRA